VYIRRPITIRRKTFLSPWKTRYPVVQSRASGKYKYRGAQQMDFARGVAELAAATRERRPSVLSERYCLHINELEIAIDKARETGLAYTVTTTFDPSQTVATSRQVP
jgi:hypothetical protein